jgi:hypothetical protein
MEHFDKIYKACDVATMPRRLPYSPDACWRALLTFVYITGWRVSELLAVRRVDVHLEKGIAITRHGDNKGRRDEFGAVAPGDHRAPTADQELRSAGVPVASSARLAVGPIPQDPEGGRNPPPLPWQARAN